MKTSTTTKYVTVGSFFTVENLKKELFLHAVLISDMFKEKLINPNRNKKIKIDTAVGKLQQCNLLEPLNDTETQGLANSTPLTENELFLILYLLICDSNQKNKGRSLNTLGITLHLDFTYHFHVKTSKGELLSISFCEFGGPFYLTAHTFDYGISGGSFYYLQNQRIAA